MKKIKRKDEILSIIGSILGAFIYSLCVKCFIQGEGINMLAGGISGVAVVISRLLERLNLNRDLMYSLFNFCLNIPLFILAFKKIGKWFTLTTVLNIALTSILTYIIPSNLFSFMNLDPETDMMLIALAAGVLTGISSGIALKLGASTGGVDILVAYYGENSSHDLGMLSFYINLGILVIGGLVFKDWNAVLYTIVYFFTKGQILNVIYNRFNKKELKIITTAEKQEELINELIKITSHGITIYDCIGGYTHSKKVTLETIVLESEKKKIVNCILNIDPNAFISIDPVNEVVGKFVLPKYK